MNKKGVTLIALTIVILVLIILSSTTVYFGVRALYKTGNFKIYSNLSLIVPKLEEIYEKHLFAPSETELPGYLLTDEMKDRLTEMGLDPDTPTWRYLVEDNLIEMGLPSKIKDPNTNLIVDYDTLEIVYTKGYRKSDGTYTYKYSEMKELEKLKE